MKLKAILAVVASLALGAASSTLMAQNGNNAGPKGRGYGGPPQNEQERAARQAGCLEKNGGVCPNGGPRTDCPGPGMGKGGKGNGAGHGWQRGARDGSGPRGANGNCPLNNAAQGQK
jgi:hypothetical protein